MIFLHSPTLNKEKQPYWPFSKLGVLCVKELQGKGCN